MKICIYDWCLHTIGGGQKFDCKIAEYLSKKHNVDILSLFPINKKKLEDAYSVDFSKIENFRYLYKKNNLNPMFLHLLSFRKVSKIAKEYGLFFNADAHETVKPTAKHNIMYCHFFNLKWPKPARNFAEFMKLAAMWLFKSALKNYAKKYDAIYCNSFYTKEWLKKKWKVNADVIYPPIDIPKKVSQNKRNIILSAGRLTLDKNYEFTIECFKAVYDSMQEAQNYECWIYGSEPPVRYYEKLKKMAEGYPIKITANPSRKELNEAYSKSKLFVQAKGLGVNGKKYPALFEHFGMTPVEAMAHGCVPVLLNKGGYKETVDDNKNGFLFNSKGEAIEKIKLLIKNNKLWQKLSKNARKKAKKFCLERMQKEIDKMMGKISMS
jgi:glycosyltransferase involved in cell wall biosynthesis